MVAGVEKISLFDRKDDKIIYPQKETDNRKWNSFFAPFSMNYS